MNKNITLKINGFNYEFFKKATLKINGVTKNYYVKEYATSPNGLKAFCYVTVNDENGKEASGHFRWIWKKFSPEAWELIK